MPSGRSTIRRSTESTGRKHNELLQAAAILQTVLGIDRIDAGNREYIPDLTDRAGGRKALNRQGAGSRPAGSEERAIGIARTRSVWKEAAVPVPVPVVKESMF